MTRQIPLQPQVPNGTCGFCMPGGCPPLRRRSRGRVTGISPPSGA